MPRVVDVVVVVTSSKKVGSAARALLLRPVPMRLTATRRCVRSHQSVHSRYRRMAFLPPFDGSAAFLAAATALARQAGREDNFRTALVHSGALAEAVACSTSAVARLSSSGISLGGDAAADALAGGDVDAAVGARLRTAPDLEVLCSLVALVRLCRNATISCPAAQAALLDSGILPTLLAIVEWDCRRGEGGIDGGGGGAAWNA